MNTKHTLRPLGRKQAERAGYTVDTHCSPWLGYKGPRFAPTDRITILTDLEAELLEALKGLAAHAHQCAHFGDMALLERADSVIEKAEGL